MITSPDIEVNEYIGRRENRNYSDFFRAVNLYHKYYGLEDAFPLLQLMIQLKKWCQYFDIDSAEVLWSMKNIRVNLFRLMVCIRIQQESL